jgi:hypothetical protein
MFHQNKKLLKHGMKKTIIGAVIVIILVLVGCDVFGQTNINVSDPFIRGNMNISYPTRVNVDDKGEPLPGFTNTFKLNVNVANSTHFGGEIVQTPTLFSSVFGREIQGGKLDYKLIASVFNPRNPATAPKPVARLIGTVPIDKKGVYLFDRGTVRLAIEATAGAQEKQKPFTGSAAGRPPKDTSMAAKAVGKAVTIKRSLGDKVVAIVVTNYDKMIFNGLTLAAGPAVDYYPDAKVSGEMLYDYERSVWYFQGVTIGYTFNGKPFTDKLTGNIRYIESPQRDSNGESEYQFDIRINEPELKANEEAFFVEGSGDAAFFDVDPNLASLTGTMKYKDTMSGKTVTQSEVSIDLVGHKLNKQQTMNLCKLILITCVVPLNDE